MHKHVAYKENLLMKRLAANTTRIWLFSAMSITMLPEYHELNIGFPTDFAHVRPHI
jgi:hypothetical protein